MEGLKATAVFAAMAALDFVWARYNIATTTSRATTAALYSVAIVLLGAFSVISYTEDHAMLLPATVGAFCGTYIAVRKG